jgi:hypothetical protein
MHGVNHMVTCSHVNVAFALELAINMQAIKTTNATLPILFFNIKIGTYYSSSEVSNFAF